MSLLGNLGEEVHTLLDEVLADNLENLVLLESLTRDVERQILRVDNTLNEVEVLGDDVLAVIHDEDAANVKLDVVTLLLGLEEVEGSTLGDVEDSLELELTLDREVLDGEMFLPVVGQTFVERAVLLGGNLGGVARPDRLGLVELLVLNGLLLNLLGLLLLVLFIVDLFDFGLFLVLLLLDGFFLVLDLLFGVSDLIKSQASKKFYLLNLLGHRQLNGIRDEFGVLLDDVLDALLLKVFELILLKVEANLGTTAKRRVDGVGGDSKGTTGSGLPDVLLVVIVLRDDLDTLGDEVGRVETDTELTNHGDVGAGAESLHKALQMTIRWTYTRTKTRFTHLSARLGNRTEVVNHVGFGHTNTGVTEGEDLVLFVGDDADEEVLPRVKDRGVGQRLVADLVEGIGGVRDELS